MECARWSFIQAVTLVIPKSELKMHPFQLFVATLLLCGAALVTADESGCGGLLLGEYGRFEYPANQSKKATTVSSCLWTILLPTGSDVRFTLDTFSSDSHQLVLYPEQNPTRRALSSLRLNSSDVGSSVEFKGRTLIVILPGPESALSFTWESLSENEEKIVVAANYIDTTEGSLEWRQRKASERLTYAISAHDSTVIAYRTTVEPYSCSSEDPCECFYFGIFEVAPSGSLIEAGRICGETSSEGTLVKSTSHVVAFVYTNVESSGLNRVAISWQSQPGGTTTASTTTTELPADDVGILAATSAGLLAISLDTLNATVISSPEPLSIVFDAKRGKAVWSESGSIKRAYPDGTELEVLKAVTGPVYGIAIDSLTGNIYYSDYNADRIMICETTVEFCLKLATAPDVGQPIGIAVHVEQRQVYWANRAPLYSITKANMDGSNATQIIGGLTHIHSIVVDSETERIYWSDEFSNRIETIDLEGGDRRTLVAFLGDPRPFGLGIHRNLFYIGNWLANSIQSVDKYTGGNRTTLYSANGHVRQLAIIDQTVKHYAHDNNPCERNACSHLCVPTSSDNTYGCLCPENMRLGGNRLTCLYSE